MPVRVVVDHEIARHLGMPDVVSVPTGNGGRFTLRDVLANLESEYPGPGKIVVSGRLVTFIGLLLNGQMMPGLDTEVRDGDLIRLHFRFMEGG